MLQRLLARAGAPGLTNQIASAIFAAPHPLPPPRPPVTQYYCPAGQSLPAPPLFACPPGNYSSLSGGAALSSCAPCPSGQICSASATVVPTPCPSGSYCPQGSARPTPCPASTFNNATGARTVRECAACLPGWYCASSNLTAPTGKCDPGYYCLAGSNTSAPAPASDPLGSTPLPIGGRCPSGGFCPQGSSAPFACPQGTFGNVTGAWNATSCIACPSGSVSIADARRRIAPQLALAKQPQLTVHRHFPTPANSPLRHAVLRGLEQQLPDGALRPGLLLRRRREYPDAVHDAGRLLLARGQQPAEHVSGRLLPGLASEELVHALRSGLVLPV